MKYKKRRRLKDYDYSSNGAYFITICTFDKINYFWNSNLFKSSEQTVYTDAGHLICTAIENIPSIYPSVMVDNYVIMPNHIHLILVLSEANSTVSNIVGQLKRQITLQLGFPIFQRSFHDHIIRNAQEYEQIWNYIEDNPRKWNEDKYYLETTM